MQCLKELDPAARKMTVKKIITSKYGAFDQKVNAPKEVEDEKTPTKKSKKNYGVVAAPVKI